MNDHKVCAIVVTYNRKDYLVKLLEGLFSQTYKLDALLIFDNNSTDGTNKKLMDMEIIDDFTFDELHTRILNKIRVMYFRNSINAGGAGGFYGGIKLATDMEFDYLWCMDDDVLPAINCLEILMNHVSDKARLCIPTRTDNRYKDFAVLKVNMSNPLFYKITTRKKWLYNNEIPGDSIEVQDMPFEGPLIAVSLVKEIGLPKKELFIIFDDSEYAYRASKKTKLLYCKSAVLHKQIIPKSDGSVLMNWKNYYGWRNQFWFDRTYGENILVRKFRPIFQVADLYLRSILKGKWSNIRVINKAYDDAVHGRLGKLVEPGTPGNKI